MSLMMLSLTAFSQIGTNNEVKCFPVPVVKQIMKDLLSGDEAKLQLELSDSLLVLTENKVKVQDSIINEMKLKEENYLNQINSEKEKLVISENYTKQLEKDLKKEKVKNKFTSILSVAVITALTTLLIIP
jgi:maltodextrin utilization protein YvdJ